MDSLKLASKRILDHTDQVSFNSYGRVQAGTTLVRPSTAALDPEPLTCPLEQMSVQANTSSMGTSRSRMAAQSRVSPRTDSRSRMGRRSRRTWSSLQPGEQSSPHIPPNAKFEARLALKVWRPSRQHARRVWSAGRGQCEAYVGLHGGRRGERHLEGLGSRGPLVWHWCVVHAWVLMQVRVLTWVLKAIWACPVSTVDISHCVSRFDSPDNCLVA